MHELWYDHFGLLRACVHTFRPPSFWRWLFGCIRFSSRLLLLLRVACDTEKTHVHLPEMLVRSKVWNYRNRNCCLQTNFDGRFTRLESSLCFELSSLNDVESWAASIQQIKTVKTVVFVFANFGTPSYPISQNLENTTNLTRTQVNA